MFAYDPLSVGLSALGIVITVVVAVVGVYFTFVVVRMRFGYISSAEELVAGMPDAGIGLTYDGETVERVTRAILAVRNAGNTPVLHASISDPISFDFDGNILEVNVSGPHHVHASAEYNLNTLKLDFTVLEKGEQFDCIVLHTGTLAEPVAHGHIVGAEGDIEDLRPVYVRRQKRRVFAQVFAVALVTLFVGTFAGVLIQRKQNKSASHSLDYLNTSPTQPNVTAAEADAIVYLEKHIGVTCTGIHPNMTPGQTVVLNIVVPTLQADVQVQLGATLIGRLPLVTQATFGTFSVKKGGAPRHITKVFILPEVEAANYVVQLEVNLNGINLEGPDCKTGFALNGG